MPVSKGEQFAARDVYIEYDFEDVLFRWDHAGKKIYRRFRGEAEHPDPVPADNRLFNDALRFGEEISRERYEAA